MAVVKAPYVIRSLPGKADAIGVRTVPPSFRLRVGCAAAASPHPGQPCRLSCFQHLRPQLKPRRFPLAYFYMDLTSLLPADVLAYVCEFFPLLPRLFVISFVSRRWCAAARRSIKEVSGVKIANAQSLMRAHLPSLTSLTPRGDLSGDLRAWSSLRSVSLKQEVSSSLALPSSLTAFYISLPEKRMKRPELLVPLHVPVAQSVPD